MVSKETIDFEFVSVVSCVCEVIWYVEISFLKRSRLKTFLAKVKNKLLICSSNHSN